MFTKLHLIALICFVAAQFIVILMMNINFYESLFFLSKSWNAVENENYK